MYDGYKGVLIVATIAPNPLETTFLHKYLLAQLCEVNVNGLGAQFDFSRNDIIVLMIFQAFHWYKFSDTLAKSSIKPATFKIGIKY